MASVRIIAQATILDPITTTVNGIYLFRAPCNGLIVRVALQAVTGPTGGNFVVNIKAAGASLWTLSADRLKILSGATLADEEDESGVGTSGASAVSKDALITLDATTVPSSVGGPLYVSIEFAETDASLNDPALEAAAAGVANTLQVETVTGIAPSSTVDTYGTAKTYSPLVDYLGVGPVGYFALTSGGIFGAETVTAQITITVPTGNATLTKTFTASGATTEITNAEIFALLVAASAVSSMQLQSIAVDCKSDISSSTATVGFKFFAWGGGQGAVA